MSLMSAVIHEDASGRFILGEEYLRYRSKSSNLSTRVQTRRFIGERGVCRGSFSWVVSLVSRCLDSLNFDARLRIRFWLIF